MSDFKVPASETCNGCAHLHFGEKSGPTLLNFPTSPIVKDSPQCSLPLGAAQSLRKLNLNLNLKLIPKETYL